MWCWFHIFKDVCCCKTAHVTYLLLAGGVDVNFDVCHSIPFAVELSEAGIFKYSSCKSTKLAVLLCINYYIVPDNDTVNINNNTTTAILRPFVGDCQGESVSEG